MLKLISVIAVLAWSFNVLAVSPLRAHHQTPPPMEAASVWPAVSRAQVPDHRLALPAVHNHRRKIATDSGRAAPDPTAAWNTAAPAAMPEYIAPDMKVAKLIAGNGSMMRYDMRYAAVFRTKSPAPSGKTATRSKRAAAAQRTELFVVV